MHRNMNARPTTPTGRTGESDRFDRHPDPALPFRFADEGDLERLKNDLLRPLLAKATATDLILQLHRAANEAAALAWLEPHPLLVFPSLFEEKVGAARKRHFRQGLVRSRTQELMEAAA